MALPSKKCLQAILACTILAKLATKHGPHFSSTSTARVLRVIADIRRNRVRVETINGHEWISQTIDNKGQASIVLTIGSIASLLALEKDDPDRLSSILRTACQEVDGPSEQRLLKLANKMHFNRTGFPSKDAPLVLC